MIRCEVNIIGKWVISTTTFLGIVSWFHVFLIGGDVGLIALSKSLLPQMQESAGSKPSALNLASVLDHLNKSIKNVRRDETNLDI